MRISDWSSDVCSSDLRASRRRTLSGRPAPVNGGSNAPSNARSRQERLPKDGNGEDHKEDPGNRVDGPDRRTRQAPAGEADGAGRSEEHTSELQSLMRISYAVFCLKKKKY